MIGMDGGKSVMTVWLDEDDDDDREFLQMTDDSAKIVLQKLNWLFEKERRYMYQMYEAYTKFEIGWLVGWLVFL